MLRTLLLTFVLSLSLPVSAFAEAFLTEAPDVPVIDGYGEVPSIGSAFDKPDGRIIEAFIAGRGKAAEALAFYAQTLPQLGWQASKADTVQSLVFVREGERLTLSIAAETDLVTVLLLQIGPAGN